MKNTYQCARNNFMSPPLNNTQEVTQLVLAADGRVLWVSYGREEGGGNGGSGLGVGVGLGGAQLVAPAVYSYVPQEGGEAERVFTLNMGVAIELPGFSGRDDRADVNRAAFIAEWMHDGERRLGCASGNKTARGKALMASALVRRMNGQPGMLVRRECRQGARARRSRVDILVRSSRGRSPSVCRQKTREEWLRVDL